MSGNEFNPRNAENDELVFTELIEQFQPNTDIGIQQFEATAKEVCESLAASYVGGEGDVTLLDSDLEDEIEDLDELWMYEGEVATVTGTLYVNDYYIGEHLPKEWGTRRLDEASGTEYYVVENATLRSVGVGIDGLRDADDVLIDVKPTYAFALPDDEDEKALVYAYAGELFRHEYETPSLQEAERFLERYHAEALDLIHAALTPDGEVPLPQRLLTLVEQLQDTFTQSPKCRKSVEQYLQYYCSFDQKSAYKMVLKERLELFDGVNILTQSDDPEMWQGYALSEPLTLSANNPLLKFLAQDDGSTECYFQVLRYNTQSGDADPEFIRVHARDITTFRSTEAERSLLSMLRVDMAQFKTLTPDIFALDLNEDEQETVELSVESAPSPEGFARPERIDELEALEDALRTALDRYVSARAVLYATPEEAMEASHRFVYSELTEVLSAYRLAASFEMAVAGEGVRYPEITKRVDGSTEDDEMYRLVYTFNAEHPLKSLELGDKRLVMLEGAHVSIEYDEDADGYRIRPSFTVIPRPDTEVLAQYEHINVLTSHMSEVLFVALDDSAEVTFPLLDAYRASQSYIAALSEAPELSAVATQLEALQDTVIEAIDVNDFVTFDPQQLFRQIDELTHHEGAQKSTRDAVVGVLDALLMRRVVQVDGEMLVKDFESGEYVPFVRDESEALRIGKVMDIRSDIQGSDIYLIIHDANEDALVAVRMKTVTQLMF